MLRQFISSLISKRTNLVRNVGSSGENKGNFPKNSISKEEKLTETLKRSMPGITYISVEDISGGCGAMYEVTVEAAEFKGLPKVMQHRLVTDALKSEISEMHGIRIHTTPPLNN